MDAWPCPVARMLMTQGRLRRDDPDDVAAAKAIYRQGRNETRRWQREERRNQARRYR
jgi:hypothetical protein